MGLFSKKNEPIEAQIMRKAFRKADRRIAAHKALAPVTPSRIDPRTGRTNRDMRAKAKARRASTGVYGRNR